MSIFSTPNFEICRIGGVPIRVDVSLALLVGYYILRTGSVPMAIVVTFAIVAAIALHELGHVFAAKRFGTGVSDITIMFFGGAASMYNLPREPWKEAAIAFAGPAAGFLLWIVLPMISALSGGIFAPLLLGIADISFFLAVFNLIPAYPMDGGRILRSLLSYKFGRIAGTRIAAKASFPLAVLMGLYGLFSGSIFLLVIAFFIWSSAKNELESLQYFDDDDTVITSPPPYGKGRWFSKIKRNRK